MRAPMRRLVLVAALLAAAAASARAAAVTGAFLKIPVGARPASLGGAYTAIADGPSSTFWNPAGLMGSSRQFSASNAQLFGDIVYSAASYSQPLSWAGPGAGIGLSVAYMNQGSVESRSADRSASGSFGASDMVVGLSFGRPAWEGASLGVTGKFIRSQIADVSASGFAADLGFKSATSIRGLTVGLAARNVGQGLKYVEEREHLPTTLSAGAALTLGPLTFVADATRHVYEQQLSWGLGTEAALIGSLTARAGYSLQPTAPGSTLGGLGGLGAGLGLKAFGMQVDYAFTPMGDLGSAQRLTLSGRF